MKVRVNQIKRKVIIMKTELNTEAFDVTFEQVDERINFICEEAARFLTEDDNGVEAA
jgi:hypothetical protein